jgi:hypothetical protein
MPSLSDKEKHINVNEGTKLRGTERWKKYWEIEIGGKTFTR